MFLCIYIYKYAAVSIYTYIYIYGKRKFVFLGRQMINDNRGLLFQQTCPCMYRIPFGIPSSILIGISRKIAHGTKN